MSARQRHIAGLMDQAAQRRQDEAWRTARAIRAERVGIAHELDDIVTHSLTVMTVQAGVGRRVMAKRPDEIAKALGVIEVAGRTAQDELEVVLGLLRDDDSEGADLASAPGLADLPELVEMSARRARQLTWQSPTAPICCRPPWNYRSTG